MNNQEYAVPLQKLGGLVVDRYATIMTIPI